MKHTVGALCRTDFLEQFPRLLAVLILVKYSSLSCKYTLNVSAYLVIFECCAAAMHMFTFTVLCSNFSLFRVCQF